MFLVYGVRGVLFAACLGVAVVIGCSLWFLGWLFVVSLTWFGLGCGWVLLLCCEFALL